MSAVLLTVSISAIAIGIALYSLYSETKHDAPRVVKQTRLQVVKQNQSHGTGNDVSFSRHAIRDSMPSRGISKNDILISIQNGRESHWFA